MRSIGTGCRALTTLDISHNKLISDVGIASIASGCPKLKTLIAPGLYLLADPRLSAPKKGQKAEAWQSVVGVAALDKYCREIERLNLSGSFRLNTALRRHVSCLSQLRALGLAGCNQCTVESLTAVAKGCPLLQELNLADCGKAVNNASVTAFAESCRGLKVVSLARCDSVRGGAIRALATCEDLEKLDLTGCKYLNDMMLLPLTEIDKVPKLSWLSVML